MAKKTGGPNKSQAIRDYYAANPEAKPKQVVEALAAQGIDVSPAFVSTIKSTSKGDKPATRRGPRASKSTRGAVAALPAPRAAASSNKRSDQTISIDNLLKAKDLVKELGGIDNAINTLSALKQLAD